MTCSGVRADLYAGDVDDRAGLVPFARDQLVRLEDVHRALDAGQRIEHLGFELALVADRADQRPLGAARHMDLEPGGTNPGLDRGDLGVAGFGLHDDDHFAAP